MWPTVVNLLVFGTLTRPPAEKGADLFGVRTTASQPSGPGEGEWDLDRLRELKASLTADAPVAPAVSAPAAPPPAATLAASHAEPALISTDRDKHFVKNPSDFYPIDRRVTPERPTRQNGD